MTIKSLEKQEYASSYQPYIDQCGEKELIKGLKDNLKELSGFFKAIPISKHEFSYDVGKWTIKELVQHIIDSERVFSYRALTIARQDKTFLPGFEQDDYVPTSKANDRSFDELLEELKLVRQSTIALFNSFDKSMLLSTGNANKSKMSVRAIGFIAVGHVNHHIKVIQQRYI